jgi:hypothetical protein
MIATKPIAIATVACALFGCMATSTPQLRAAAEAEAAKPAPSAADATGLPIRSLAQLETWLQTHAGKQTPLDRMPPGARMRFLASLRFGERGLGGFDPADLGATLTPDEIRAVLALFGPDVEAFAAHIPSTRLPEGSNATSMQATSSIEQRFNELYLFDLHLGDATDLERGKALASRYLALFPDARDADYLRGISDPDLKLLYRAAHQANFYNPGTATSAGMAAAIDAMAARGIASADELQDARDALLAARQFDSAQRFSDAHAAAQLPPLPRIRGADADFGDQATLWQLDAGSDTLERSPVDTAPLQVLVLAGCHFSADAARDIVADPVLGPLFRLHGHWLSLPPGQEDLQAVRDWNREHPQAPMEMLYDRGEWPMFTRWSMPTFYVVRDGKVLGSMAGWSTSSREELVALLRRTGLLL